MARDPKPGPPRASPPVHAAGSRAPPLASGAPRSAPGRWGQRGRQHDKVRFFQPLIAPAQKAPLSLSFWNLVELYVLRSLRRTHDFPMPKVWAALRFTGEKLGARRPLIEETFYSDGSKPAARSASRRSIHTSDGQTIKCAAFSSTHFAASSAGPNGRVLRLDPWAERTHRGAVCRDSPNTWRPAGLSLCLARASRRKRSPNGLRRGTTSTSSARDFELDVLKCSRRSGGSSARRVQRDEVVFFVDRCLGAHTVPDALREAGANVEVHGAHSPATTFPRHRHPSVCRSARVGRS